MLLLESHALKLVLVYDKLLLEYKKSDKHFFLTHNALMRDFSACSWEKPGHSPLFGYDFWYQPRHKTMISSSWGAPVAFRSGFDLQHVKDGLYGRHLHVYDWPGGELKQTLDLGETGLLPLEVHRFSDIKSAESAVRIALH
jgi:hypothetical protein